MIIPTTTQQVLQLSPEKAEEILDHLEELLVAQLPDYEPPADFQDPGAVWMLAYLVDMLNKLSARTDTPFGPDGWLGLIPEDELGEHA